MPEICGPVTAAATVVLDDRTASFRFLVRDRAGQLTTAFDTVLAAPGSTR